MKKTTVILALVLGFLFSNLNAMDNLTSKTSIVKTVEVSPLCKAVATGNTKEVKRLIKNGANVNAKSNGMLPIHYAAKYNRVELIKLLITAGSKIHSTCDAGYTALKYAEKTNAKDAALFLKRFKKRSA